MTQIPYKSESHQLERCRGEKFLQIFFPLSHYIKAKSDILCLDKDQMKPFVKHERYSNYVEKILKSWVLRYCTIKYLS